jgi:hypothetical protein
MGAEQERRAGSAVSNVKFTIRLFRKFLKDFPPIHCAFYDKRIEHIRPYGTIGNHKNAVLLLQCLAKLVQ